MVAPDKVAAPSDLQKLLTHQLESAPAANPLINGHDARPRVPLIEQFVEFADVVGQTLHLAGSFGPVSRQPLAFIGDLRVHAFPFPARLGLDLPKRRLGLNGGGLGPLFIFQRRQAVGLDAIDFGFDAVNLGRQSGVFLICPHLSLLKEILLDAFSEGFDVEIGLATAFAGFGVKRLGPGELFRGGPSPGVGLSDQPRINVELRLEVPDRLVQFAQLQEPGEELAHDVNPAPEGRRRTRPGQNPEGPRRPHRRRS